MTDTGNALSYFVLGTITLLVFGVCTVFLSGLREIKNWDKEYDDITPKALFSALILAFLIFALFATATGMIVTGISEALGIINVPQ